MQRIVKSFPSVAWLVASLFGAVLIAHAEPVPFDGGWEDRIEEGGTTYCIVAYTNVGEHVWSMPIGVTELAIDCLVVGGGGGGGGSWGGGGGAGGFIYKQGLIATGDLTVTIGAGGAGGVNKTRGKSGDPSSLIGSGVAETALGGGAGGTYQSYSGLKGGSGGGTAGVGAAGFSSSTGVGGAGTEGQGNAGGNRTDVVKTISGAGGGGAGEPGQDYAGYSSSDGGKGGDGLPCGITGEEVYYAGGGGGGNKSTEKYQRLGGVGGGGAGGWDKTAKPAGDDGTDGLGGGGGGGYGESAAAAVGGRGGSGVVIIRYAEPKVDLGALLLVSGDPADYGEVSPAYGQTEGLKAGDERTCSVVAQWIDEAGTTRAVCTGYTVYTNDAVYVEGTFEGEEPKSFTYVHPVSENGVRLVWHWQLQYKVDVAESDGGRVERSGGDWRLPGDTGTVRATPADGYRFGCWMTGAPSGHELEPELTFSVGEGPTVLEANFQKEVYVSKSGSDENAGTSWDDALATVTAALEKYATPYVIVDDGVYDITSGLQLTNSITVCGRNAEGAVIRLKEQPVAGDKTRCVFFLDHVAARVHHIAAAGIWNRSRDDQTAVQCGRGICLYNGLVENCVISNNQTVSRTTNGGGAYVKGGVMRNCLIRSNKARSSASSPQHGGGVCLAGGLVENCTITGNYAENGTGSHGGGVYATGGTLRNCLVNGNYATTYSGGVYAKNATIENCTIVDNNHSTASTCYGLTAMDGAVVRNTIVRYNTSAGSELNVSRSTNTTFEHCISDVESEGVAAGDPAFADPENGDWHVGFGPCVDAGTNQAWMVGATDLDGNGRVQNNIVDLGCYETDPNDDLKCGIKVTTDGAFDLSMVTLTATVGGADPAKVAYAWTLTDDTGNVTTTNLNGIVSVTLTVSPGTYAVALQVSDGTKTASAERFGAIVVLPSTVYVSKTGANIPPYDTLAKATPDLNVAFRSLTDGMTVAVDDGTYTLSKGQTINLALTVRSLNGPEKTTLSGMDGDMPRAFVLQHEKSSVCGFTFANFVNTSGSQPGEALRLAKAGAVVSNCVFRGCAANFSGGAISMAGGLLVDCLVTNCWALTSTDKTLYGQAIQAENADSVIERCVIRDCGLSRNSLTTYSAVSLSGGAQMRNSVVAHNRSRGEGGVRLTGASVMENCTVVDNIANASNQVAGVSAGSMASVVNTIIWNNTNTVDEVIAEIGGDDSVFDTCCTNNPCFRRRGAPWRLSNASPCLNAGKPLDWMDGAVDLYGNPRILYGKPDIGAVESPYSPGLILLMR